MNFSKVLCPWNLPNGCPGQGWMPWTAGWCQLIVMLDSQRVFDVEACASERCSMGMKWESIYERFFVMKKNWNSSHTSQLSWALTLAISFEKKNKRKDIFISSSLNNLPLEKVMLLDSWFVLPHLLESLLPTTAPISFPRGKWEVNSIHEKRLETENLEA